MALASCPKEQATETDVALFRACSTTTTQGANRISKQVFALLSVFLSVVFGFGSVQDRFDDFPTICPEHQFLAGSCNLRSHGRACFLRHHNFYHCDPFLSVDGFDHQSTSSVVFGASVPVPSHLSPFLPVLATFSTFANNSQFQKMIRLLFVFFERVLHVVVNQNLRGKQFSLSTTNLDTTIVLVPLSHRVMAIDPFVSHFAVRMQLHKSTFTVNGNRKVKWAIFSAGSTISPNLSLLSVAFWHLFHFSLRSSTPAHRSDLVPNASTNAPFPFMLPSCVIVWSHYHIQGFCISPPLSIYLVLHDPVFLHSDHIFIVLDVFTVSLCYFRAEGSQISCIRAEGSQNSGVQTEGLQKLEES